MIQDVFAALADPTRRSILEQLQSGERAVGELVEVVDASQPTVSKHLRVLREIGLVSQRAVGQRRYYRVEARPLREAADLLVRYAQGGAADPSADLAHGADDVPAAAPELTVAAEPTPEPASCAEPEPETELESVPEPQLEPALEPEAVESQIGIDPVDTQRLDPYAVRSESENGPRHVRPLTVGGLVSSMLRGRRR